MQEADVRKLLKTSKEIVELAYENILKYQNGVMIPAKTGYPYLDDAMLGGFYPQNAIAIGARPGVGKSYVSQKIMENVMNPEVNPQSLDYLLVNCEFEMNPNDLLLRRLNREMDKPIKDILKKQNPLEQIKIKEVLHREIKKNILYIPSPCTADEFEAVIDFVCSKNREKKLIIFKIDHMGLFNRLGGDAKKTMDNILACINKAKLTYHNVFFFIISQFNRNIEDRRSPKEHEPRMSDFYQSDELGQLCSLMVGLNNPRRMGYPTYMSFPENWYNKLTRFKTDSKTSFKTDGLLFHHILKLRQIRIEELEDIIYPEVMPGWGAYYGEGGVKYVNTSRPPVAPKSYEVLNDSEEEKKNNSPY